MGERVHDLRELVASRSGALLRTALGGPSDRAHRRRRALTTTAVPLLVLVALAAASTVFGAPWRSGGAADPGDGARPGAGSSSGSALRAAVRDGRFVRPVSFDGGALTVNPAGTGPAVGENQALDLFRTTGGGPGHVLVRDVVVGYGVVTLDPRLGNPGVAPLASAPAWVVVFSDAVQHCPLMTAVPGYGSAGRHVLLVDARGATWGLSYRERGSSCGRAAAGDTLAVADRFESIAWTPLVRNGSQLTIGYPSGGCLVSDTTTIEGGSTAQQVQVVGHSSFRVMRCPAPTQRAQTLALPSATTPVTHAATGPLRSYVTDVATGRLDVYDGR